MQRAIAILREFSESEPALGVTEISGRLDLHKSTVSRILGVLRDEGMVWQNPETGGYSLGMGLVEMAGVALGQIDVRAAAMPHLQSLGTEVDETVSVVVGRGREAVTVATFPGTQPIRHVVWIGRRLPFRTTAAGKVLLAAMLDRGEDWRTVVGGSGLDSRGGEEFAADLVAITDRGYATERDEFEMGTAAIAAPVLDQSGTAAALSISGPSDRFDPDSQSAALPHLIATAAAIAADLGVSEPTDLVEAHR